ncbi:hypothetical protein MGA3_15566 [Bacillus methanolicus MGA3]|uniref:Uncharacterized protein n=1 Tax=Bacillus methanolicus (strain MGA3 / ATCC 53907) TaxID=796606 RepID=I3DU61_BACMM|nr:hypothetical protein BMMGA3_14865 [Bacillus methanolicus MGA3]EIJ77782.1 hypothetical protein MGA3_15566 [Bacillus methanolicus MGA3]
MEIFSRELTKQQVLGLYTPTSANITSYFPSSNNSLTEFHLPLTVGLRPSLP